ncbi:unnamed protein product [Dracunculus medinensis]|uniref:Galectin n=1 Tax=Dracunculus medinensis TaxID=318479 RepID=A0A0N4UGE0_DRAME|nr:unnamed protein product [Dracunculus medinensis]
MSHCRKLENVNLLQGGVSIETSKAVILHVSVRFDEGKIVLNTMQNGDWEKEERHKNPFSKKGNEFDLKIRAHVEKYEITANNVEIAEFKCRIPLSNVEFFAIHGDVKLASVHWGGRYYTIPVEMQFHNGYLANGSTVYIHGIPIGERFNIDFVARNGAILFHYNPRFKEKKVVRNSFLIDSWGKEEREGPFPFKKNHNFALEIQNQPYSLQIFCDGEHIGAFAHRAENPANDYHGLRIAGDIELIDIQFQDHYQT